MARAHTHALSLSLKETESIEHLPGSAGEREGKWMHQSTARRGNTRAAHLTRSSPRSLEDPVPRRAHLSCSSALQEAISSGTPGPPTPLEWSRDPCHHRPRVARPPHQPGVFLSLSRRVAEGQATAVNKRTTSRNLTRGLRLGLGLPISSHPIGVSVFVNLRACTCG